MLGEVYKEPAGNASAYGKFYHAHLGLRAFFDETEERKEHLSLVMAARTAQASHEEFSLKTIERLASAIRNSPGFKNLTDRDLREGLLDRNNALKVHKKVIEGNYGVPKKDQADYIRKMGELSKAMIPGKGQSAAYRRLHRAVKGISGLVGPSIISIDKPLSEPKAPEIRL